MSILTEEDIDILQSNHCAGDDIADHSALIRATESAILAKQREQSEPVGYVRAYAIEHLSKPGQTVINSAPQADNDLALYLHPHVLGRCIGVIDANGDIYPEPPEAGTQIFTSPQPLPEGMVMVPREPTLAMLDCLRADTTSNLEKRYRAMIAAAENET